MKKEDFDVIIEKAIANEEEANRFYTQLAESVTDKAAKDTLLYLAKEEMGHKNYLMRYRQESFITNATNIDELPDCKVTEFIGSPGIKYDMESKDAFLLASARELNSSNSFNMFSSNHSKPNPCSSQRFLMISISSLRMP